MDCAHSTAVSGRLRRWPVSGNARNTSGPFPHGGRRETLLGVSEVACLPRRRDGVEVIGEALLAKAQGAGHRTIAARLERPPVTVRGWLRAFAGRAETMRCALCACGRPAVGAERAGRRACCQRRSGTPDRGRGVQAAARDPRRTVGAGGGAHRRPVVGHATRRARFMSATPTPIGRQRDQAAGRRA